MPKNNYLISKTSKRQIFKWIIFHLLFLVSLHLYSMDFDPTTIYSILFLTDAIWFRDHNKIFNTTSYSILFLTDAVWFRDHNKIFHRLRTCSPPPSFTVAHSTSFALRQIFQIYVHPLSYIYIYINREPVRCTGKLLKIKSKLILIPFTFLLYIYIYIFKML